MKIFLNGRPVAESEIAREDYESSADLPCYVPDGYARREIGAMMERTDIYWSAGKYYTVTQATELFPVQCGQFVCRRID